MRYKKLAALLLAVMLVFCMAAGPAYAAAPQLPAAENAAAAPAEENEIVKLPVSVVMQVNKGAVYGEPCGLTVTTDPENVQYVGVVVGVSGQAKGTVDVLLPEKVRILLKLIPLPRAMASESLELDETAVFSVYEYVKQLIDGREVEELLKVAEEVAVLLEALEYYVPDLQGVGGGIRDAVDLVNTYLPDGLATRVYLDEEPREAGRYVMGALTVDSRYVNTSVLKTFTIRQKSDGVWAEWSAQAPVAMTAAEAAQFDFGARVYDNGTEAADTVEYTYTGWSGWRYYKSSEPPTQPGRYTQSAAADGNYRTAEIRRSFQITG